MNVYSLLENKLVELPMIRKCINRNMYEKLYEQYANVINDLLFLETKREFMNFISEQKELKEESFLLALAYKKGLCCSFGMYEENIGIILQQYLQTNSQICVEFDEMKWNIDLLVDYINKVNASVECSLKRYIILLDDTYCEGCIYIFCVTDDESLEDWESIQIERLL